MQRNHDQLKSDIHTICSCQEIQSFIKLKAKAVKSHNCAGSSRMCLQCFIIQLYKQVSSSFRLANRACQDVWGHLSMSWTEKKLLLPFMGAETRSRGQVSRGGRDQKDGQGEAKGNNMLLKKIQVFKIFMSQKLWLLDT